MHYYLCRQSILSLVYIFYGYFIAIRSIHSKHIGCADLFTIAAATVSDCDIPLNLNNDNRFCISTAPINYTKTSYWLILEFSCFSFFARSSEHGCDKQNDVIRTYREQNSKIRLLFFQKPRSRANWCGSSGMPDAWMQFACSTIFAPHSFEPSAIRNAMAWASNPALSNGVKVTFNVRTAERAQSMLGVHVAQRKTKKPNKNRLSADIHKFRSAIHCALIYATCTCRTLRCDFFFSRSFRFSHRMPPKHGLKFCVVCAEHGEYFRETPWTKKVPARTNELW